MSADDQVFLDVLSSLPNSIRQYSNEVADFIDDHVDKAASAIREALASSPWIPDSIRPIPPAPPIPVAMTAATRLAKVQDWVMRNKILTGVVVVAFGTVAYKSYSSSRFHRKSRRARRARNGGRVEVIVIAGSPALPLTKSLSLDMERKGFIVYIVCSASEDEAMVHGLARPDIRPLAIDITDPPSAGASMERFAGFLQKPHSPGPNIRPNILTLKAVILIPSLNYQTSPIATIPPSSFADLFNTHLLHPILTIQSFLPLLTARLCPVGEKWTPPKVIVFTPSIISSINPPFHAPEATVCSALSAFTEVLTAELRPLSIPVTHVQLGTFDFSGFTPVRGPAFAHGLLTGPEADAANWPESARYAYARNFAIHSSSAVAGGRIRGMRGSSLRRLHNAVFDVVEGSNTSNTVRIGLGASVYGFVGRWVPRGLVTWMMGIRRVDELSTWQGSSEEGDSSRAPSDDGDSGSREFVNVPQEGLGPNVWRET